MKVKLESRSQKAEKVELSAEEKCKVKAASVWTTWTARPSLLEAIFRLCRRRPLVNDCLFDTVLELG